MICYTESEARMLMKVFQGITARVIAISSMDVYRAYGVILGKESGLEKGRSQAKAWSYNYKASKGLKTAIESSTPLSELCPG